MHSVSSHARRVWLLAALVCAAAGMWAARPAPPKPTHRFELQPLGFRPPAARILQSGMTVETVNFAGNHRLLVTFTARGLIKRDPNQRESDHDRLVHAVLLQMPSGAVLAQTDWRLHDPLRYLWSLRGGRFLLRNRDSLYLIDTNIDSADRLEPLRVWHTLEGQELRAMDVTPDGRLVSVQSSAVSSDDPDVDTKSSRIDMRFLRVLQKDVHEVGRARLEHTVGTPYNDVGLLGAERDKDPYWGFVLHGFRGGEKELAAIETSCQPAAAFLSQGEFLIAGCRGGDVRSMMGVLDTRGEVLWLGPGPNPSWPAVVSAPAAERMAVRNTLANSPSSYDLTVAVQVQGQEVTVYRTYTGDKLLTVPVGPSMMSGQNFDLSDDGESLVVVQDSAVEVYALPPVTKKDLETAKKYAETVTVEKPKE